MLRSTGRHHQQEASYGTVQYARAYERTSTVRYEYCSQMISITGKPGRASQGKGRHIVLKVLYEYSYSRGY